MTENVCFEVGKQVRKNIKMAHLFIADRGEKQIVCSKKGVYKYKFYLDQFARNL